MLLLEIRRLIKVTGLDIGRSDVGATTVRVAVGRGGLNSTRVSGTMEAPPRNSHARLVRQPQLLWIWNLSLPETFFPLRVSFSSGQTIGFVWLEALCGLGCLCDWHRHEEYQTETTPSIRGEAGSCSALGASICQRNRLYPQLRGKRGRLGEEGGFHSMELQVNNSHVVRIISNLHFQDHQSSSNCLS